MSLTCEYKARIQNLEKSEQLYDLISQIPSSRESSWSNLLKSLERAITAQREDANRLQKKMSIALKIWIKIKNLKFYGQASKGMKRLDTKGKEWGKKIPSTHQQRRRINLNIMNIMNKSDELPIDKFKIGMTIACSFIAVDLLITTIGYVGLY